MKAKFRVRFDTPAGCLGLADLNTEISFAPNADMEFQSLAWNGDKKVLSISYMIEEDEFFVVLSPDEITDAEATLYAESYRSRGWELVGVIAGK